MAHGPCIPVLLGPLQGGVLVCIFTYPSAHLKPNLDSDCTGHLPAHLTDLLDHPDQISETKRGTKTLVYPLPRRVSCIAVIAFIALLGRAVRTRRPTTQVTTTVQIRARLFLSPLPCLPSSVSTRTRNSGSVWLLGGRPGCSAVQRDALQVVPGVGGWIRWMDLPQMHI